MFKNRLPAAARKPLLPVHGTCRWHLRPVAPTATTPAGSGILAITVAEVESQYLFEFLSNRKGQVEGYSLTKVGGDKVEAYHLPADLASCDCPDGTFKPHRPEGGCKHRKAVRAALVAIGFQAPSPSTQVAKHGAKPAAYRSTADVARNAPEVFAADYA